jgi:hypothetical protein
MHELTLKTVLYLVHYFAKKVDADLEFCPERLIKENFLAGFFLLCKVLCFHGRY